MKYLELREKALKIKRDNDPLMIDKCTKILNTKSFINSHISVIDRFEERKKNGEKLNKHTVKAYFDRLKKFVEQYEKK